MKTTQRHSFRKLRLLAVLLLPVIGYAQAVDSTYKKFNLSVGYGLISYFTTPNQEVTYDYLNDTADYMMSSQTDILVTNVKIKPIYVRFDYKWDKKNSIGFMATYNGYSASGTRTYAIWNNNSSSYDASSNGIFYSMHRLRFQVVYTRHFFVDRPRVNTYFYTAFGYNLKITKFRVENQEGLPTDSGLDLSRGFPVASRLCYGLRYNFSKSMSLLTEVGLGGPFLSIGLTAKF